MTSKPKQSFDVRLKRFLYASSEDPKYVIGDPERNNYYTTEKLKVVTEILESKNPELLLNIIEIVNSENVIPRRDTIFFALAVAAHASNVLPQLRHKIYATALNVFKTSEDLFTFVKFCTKQNKKFSTALNKTIGAYYFKKDPQVLTEEVCKVNGYHSWKHKDLLKLSHYKSDDVLITIVVSYVLYGYQKAKAQGEANPEATSILDYISKVEELKRSENEQRIAELIPELHCSLNRIPSFFHNSQLIWNALIHEITVGELIRYLPKLYKLGFLKTNTPFQTNVVEILTNADKIQACKIHPSEVFIGMRNFEKGGKPLDAKFVKYMDEMAEEKLKQDTDFKKPELTREPVKCPAIISALHKCMQISFQNPQPTGKRYMVTIDLSVKMDEPCLLNKNISCLDAAIILTLGLLRVEKDVVVAVFNDNRITTISLEKNTTLNQALSKLRQAKSGYVLPSSAFEWASNRKKPIDVFINIMFYHHWLLLLPKEIREKEKPLESLNRYRKKMSLPHTKLITMSLSSPHLSVADGSPNVLDVCGFDKEVPKVIEAFSRGLFY